MIDVTFLHLKGFCFGIFPILLITVGQWNKVYAADIRMEILMYQAKVKVTFFWKITHNVDLGLRKCWLVATENQLSVYKLKLKCDITKLNMMPYHSTVPFFCIIDTIIDPVQYFKIRSHWCT